MTTDPSSPLWTVILPVTALSLAPVIITTYTTAYLAAPSEISTFLDAVESSVQENESYDKDVAKVSRLEDKLRLNRLLREIHKCSDDLRKDVDQLVVKDGSTLHPMAHVLWAIHRKRLEERVRRLDMLRMRFLVAYMGIVATTVDRPKYAERTTPKIPEKTTPHHQHRPPRPVAKALSDSIKDRPQLRRLATQAGHHEKSDTPHRMGWMGVVEELQRSPLMHKRRTSIEAAMRSPPPMSPLGSPVSLTPQMDNGRFHDAVDSIPEEKI
ncbi:hypothetical protein F4677DRAFT_457610 [Hypoxylon crocopeplum]|nr:hypothetical protein F4677DRAFT_457610 [Hypoxylon crocopeplum]